MTNLIDKTKLLDFLEELILKYGEDDNLATKSAILAVQYIKDAINHGDCDFEEDTTINKLINIDMTLDKILKEIQK